MSEESNITTFAREELRRLRNPSGEPDEMQDAMEAHILRMCQAFADEGHSGFSASYAIRILEKVLRFEPVTPLTGEDDEWNEIGEGRFQNRRCPHVFKDEGVGAYDSNGIVHVEPSGAAFTGSFSRVPISFPYTPTTRYVNVDADGNPIEEASH